MTSPTPTASNQSTPEVVIVSIKLAHFVGGFSPFKSL